MGKNLLQSQIMMEPEHRKKNGFHTHQILEKFTNCKFHQQEILPYEFILEENAARQAARRVRNFAKEKRTKEALTRETERLSRWYYLPKNAEKNYHDHTTNVNDQNRSKLKRRKKIKVTNGPRIAKRRVLERKQQMKALEQAESERSKMRWYHRQEGREPTPNGYYLAKRNVKKMNQAREEALQEEQEAELRTKREHETRMRTLMQAREDAFQNARKINLHELQILDQWPPFKPGFLNEIESYFAIHGNAKPRRVFNKIT